MFCFAHSPEKMFLEYKKNKLNVEITHNVKNPENHYVFKIDIYKNGKLLNSYEYDKQPTKESFIYTYNIDLNKQDKLKVMAFCSLAGVIVGEYSPGANVVSEEKVTAGFQIWKLHAIAMSLSFFLIFLGIIYVVFLKKQKGWLSKHRLLGNLSGIFIIIGYLIAFYMVQVKTGEHFNVAHTFFGVASIFFVVIQITLGNKVFNAKDKRKRSFYKKIHTYNGYFTFILLLVTIFTGIATSGIINI